MNYQHIRIDDNKQKKNMSKGRKEEIFFVAIPKLIETKHTIETKVKLKKMISKL